MTVTAERKAYLAAWNKRRNAKVKAERLADPVSESKARRRVCRVCAMPVEAKSYWYCHAHNTLSELDDDNMLYSTPGADVSSY